MLLIPLSAYLVLLLSTPRSVPLELSTSVSSRISVGVSCSPLAKVRTRQLAGAVSGSPLVLLLAVPSSSCPPAGISWVVVNS